MSTAALPTIDDYHSEVKRQRLHKCLDVVSQAYSQDGKLLAAGSNEGDICVWNVERCLAQETEPANRPGPTLTLRECHSCSVSAMGSGSDQLYTAGGSQVKLWSWSALAEGNSAVQPSATVDIALGGQHRPEINSIAVDVEACTVLAGVGDGNIQLLDMSTGQQKGALSGHADMVHCVSRFPTESQRYASASEDGTVMLWDGRTQKPTEILNPFETLASDRKHSALKSQGKWVSSVSVDNTGSWMVCGGGVPGTVWHIGSRTMTAALAGSGRPRMTTEALFVRGEIRTLGSDPFIREWSLSGTLKRKVPTTATMLAQSASSASHGPLAMTTFCGADSRLGVFLHGLTKASFDLEFSGRDAVA